MSKKARFYADTATLTKREQHTELSPKNETAIITIELTSSGNTSVLTNEEIVNDIISRINGT